MFDPSKRGELKLTRPREMSLIEFEKNFPYMELVARETSSEPKSAEAQQTKEVLPGVGKFIEVPFPRALNGNDGIVWHYTNLDSLKSILNSGSLYASSFNYLNDKEEIHFGIKILNKILSTVWLSRHVHVKQKQFLREALIQITEKPQNNLFILSASVSEDDLAIWNAYGKDNGVSIGLNPSSPMSILGTSKEFASNKLPPLFWRKVLYTKTEQEKLLLEMISFLAFSISPEDLPGTNQWSKKVENASVLLLSAIAYCKSSEFTFEQEARIVILGASDSSINKRQSKYGETPYVKAGQTNKGPSQGSPRLFASDSLINLPIVQIYTTPLQEFSSNQGKIEEVLKHNNYGFVNLKGSNIPIRLLN